MNVHINKFFGRWGKYGAYPENNSEAALARGDSGWTSRDSSSMDRSSSVSLEEKMDELELGKMRKTVDMRSEMNLATQQFVGFGMLPDQVYNKAVRKGFEFSLMVVGKKWQLVKYPFIIAMINFRSLWSGKIYSCELYVSDRYLRCRQR